MSTIALDVNKVRQTIFATDPHRPGNCVAACAATWLGLPLTRVPHFLEIGAQLAEHAGHDRDTTAWWAMLCGFMAARGYWPIQLDTFGEAERGEVLWVAGRSPRGVMHQVLYRDGVLWHDPHPSDDGILSIEEILAWRPVTAYDHEPSAVTS